MKLLRDFLGLIYPRICICCGNSLWKHEEIICNLCHYHLPRTGFHLEAENPVTRLFWGRVQIESGTAFLWFNKGSKVQMLIHQVKYKGRKDAGIWIGREYGCFLKESPLFSTVDIILPVPLHPKKLMQRGYNQSEQFAIGLSKPMNVPTYNNILCRTRPSETQTRKSRFRRWENVCDIFAVRHAEILEGKHVLVVDDVVTTGATLEAIAAVLGNIPGIRVSVAAIAFTRV
jgi:ComF family protein